LSPLARLIATTELQALKARYFRCLDGKDWDGFEALFTEDAVFDMRDGRGTNQDPDAVVHGATSIRRFVSEAVAALVTVHQGHMPEIELLDDNQATGVWAMHDLLWPAGGSNTSFSRFEGFGHYHERYRRSPEGWRIAALKLTRLHVQAWAMGHPAT
jgi:hypothetical protein